MIFNLKKFNIALFRPPKKLLDRMKATLAPIVEKARFANDGDKIAGTNLLRKTNQLFNRPTHSRPSFY